MKNFRKRITINPEIHFGKSYVVGTRITVDNILELIKEGLSFKEIIRNYYPDLKIEDIKACIQYALQLIREEEIYAKTD
ncbi:MAG TPA: DUF433 domain-containing protein [Candidatus Wujingus californicus]|uniref:DUF433 domain-containing protein n=1 Tax=Candidatus Wujingus californicus TaxID=3367618 RepID=UPI001D1E7FE0|nr:DUF433 domain-containing protein [Planctomycetota bacterium]MDO8130322.1 DUF433 domain-containing protein [Candidatus Brocadiales bacterium]